MPAVPSFIIEPIWHQFEVLIPPVIDEHPLSSVIRLVPEVSRLFVIRRGLVRLA